MNKNFSVKEAISYSWKNVTNASNIWFYIGFAVLLAVFHILGSFVSQSGTILNIAVTLLTFYVGLVAINVGIKGAKGKQQKFSEILKGVTSKMTGHYILATVLMILAFVGILIIPIILLLVGGGSLQAPMSLSTGVLAPVLIGVGVLAVFYFSIRWQFSSYLIVDKNVKAVPSLKESFKMTKGIFWKMIWFFILLALINVVGVLALVVGTFITGPMTLVAIAHVYKQLKSSKEN